MSDFPEDENYEEIESSKKAEASNTFEPEETSKPEEEQNFIPQPPSYKSSNSTADSSSFDYGFIDLIDLIIIIFLICILTNGSFCGNTGLFGKLFD
jgi:hypothetical protein